MALDFSEAKVLVILIRLKLKLSRDNCHNINISVSRFQGLWGFLLGHFLLLAIRVWWTSLNAVWASDTFNTIVIVLGLLAVVERLYSSESPEKGKQQKMSRQLEEISSPTWSLAAIGFGSMLFLTHWLFSEASLLSRWVVTGLPNSGPPPNPWG